MNYNAGANLQPQVSEWWKVVGDYANKGPINVKETKQVTDTNYSTGKNVTRDRLKPLVEKATADDKEAIPVIFTAKDVNVQGLSAGKCSEHGVLGNLDLSFHVCQFLNRCLIIQYTAKFQLFCLEIVENKPYLIVGNPENECPGACAWPFHKSDKGPIGVILNPPNGNVGADTMIIAFAEGLVDVPIEYRVFPRARRRSD